MSSNTQVIFNDANSENSLYQQFLYPAGEMQVRIKPEHIKRVKDADQVIIYGNVTGNAADLIELSLLRDAVESFGGKCCTVVPYLPYGRADRRFCEGDCLGLNICLDLFWPKTFTLDVHSPVTCQFNNIPADPLIEQAIQQFYLDMGKPHNINILFPDEGAKQRYELVGGKRIVGCNVDAAWLNVLYCEKQRDPATGKLRGFSVPRDADFFEGPTLIIDDICDGGGTFVGIADALNQSVSRTRKLGLYVTHGIFSKGFSLLSQYFQAIYTTDSFKTTPKVAPGVSFYKRYEVANYLINEVIKRIK